MGGWVGGWGYNLLFISACVRLCVCVWCVCACVCVCGTTRSTVGRRCIDLPFSLSLSLSRCCWCRHKRLVDEANRRPRPRQSIKATVPSPRKTATDEVRPPPLIVPFFWIAQPFTKPPTLTSPWLNIVKPIDCNPT